MKHGAHPFNGALADDVLNAAGVGFRRFGIEREHGHQKFLDEDVTAVDFVGAFAALVGQANRAVCHLVHQSGLFQHAHGARHTGLGVPQLIGDINRVYDTVAHFQQKDRFQVVFARFLNFHVFTASVCWIESMSIIAQIPAGDNKKPDF